MRIYDKLNLLLPIPVCSIGRSAAGFLGQQLITLRGLHHESPQDQLSLVQRVTMEIMESRETIELLQPGVVVRYPAYIWCCAL